MIVEKLLVDRNLFGEPIIRTPALVAEPSPHGVPVTGEWFAGFFDGEGSLNIAGHGGALQPRARINQRDDDGDLVRAMRAFVGVGSLHRKTYPDNPKDRPQLAWSIVGRDCLRLVSIFDASPLRSKKRFEYPIWREAVRLYAEMVGERWSRPGLARRRGELLAPLKERLADQRRYRGSR